MSNAKSTTGQEVLKTVINILKSNILETENNIENIKFDSDSFVCYFKPLYLTVSYNNGIPQIESRTSPQIFDKSNAEYICRVIVNGRNEKPVSILASQYFPEYLQFLKDQLEIMQDMTTSF